MPPIPPMPPMPPMPPGPPGPPAGAPPAFEAMTSSIRRIITAASVADSTAWRPTRIGSITWSASMSSTLPATTLTPALFWPFLWALRSSMRMSMGSSPAFSASVRGIPSRASANRSNASCSRPPTFAASSRSRSASSLALAPPPTTMRPSSTATATTLSASSSDRSISSSTCSVPPRIRIETAFAFFAPVTNVSASSPILRSSTWPAVPTSSGVSSLTFETMFAPVALASFSMSDFLTRRTA